MSFSCLVTHPSLFMIACFVDDVPDHGRAALIGVVAGILFFASIVPLILAIILNRWVKAEALYGQFIVASIGISMSLIMSFITIVVTPSIGYIFAHFLQYLLVFPFFYHFRNDRKAILKKYYEKHIDNDFKKWLEENSVTSSVENTQV